MARYKVETLLQILSHIEWLTSYEIQEKFKERDGQNVPDFGWIYTQLDLLMRQGFVEYQIREKPDPERSNRPQREFRLTEGGLRRRQDEASKVAQTSRKRLGIRRRAPNT